jgi:hypothetical protein
VTRSFSAEVPFVEVIRQLSYRPDRLALPSPLFHEFAHQPRSVFTVTQGTEGLQIPRMVAPLLGSRDDMMDLEALPDIPTSSPSSGCVIHLPPPPSEVHAAILTNVAVPSLHRALHSDPDQATDQIRGAIGVSRCSIPRKGVLPWSFRSGASCRKGTGQDAQTWLDHLCLIGPGTDKRSTMLYRRAAEALPWSHGRRTNVEAGPRRGIGSIEGCSS